MKHWAIEKFRTYNNQNGSHTEGNNYGITFTN